MDDAHIENKLEYMASDIADLEEKVRLLEDKLHWLMDVASLSPEETDEYYQRFNMLEKKVAWIFGNHVVEKEAQKHE